WQVIHIGNAAERIFKLFALPFQHKDFFFGEILEGTSSFHPIDFFHTGNAFLNRGKVRQHSTQPAMSNIRHTAANRFRLYNILGLLLGAYEENCLIGTRELRDFIESLLEELLSFFKIDNMNPITLHKDVIIHFGIPSGGKVSEVSTCF